MKRLIASVALALLVSGWSSAAFAQATKGGDVTSGDVGAPVKKAEGERLTADDRERFKHRVSGNDELYDSIANFTAPGRNRVMPWVAGLSLGALVLFMGLKHSFRNRYEG